MSTTTTAAICDCCGRVCDARDEELRCPDCAYEAAESELFGVETALAVLGPAIDAALQYLNPADVSTLVAERASERGEWQPTRGERLRLRGELAEARAR